MTEPEAKMLPCPFCGGANLHTQENGIWCKNKDCAGGIDFGHWTGDGAYEAVVDAWNRRAPASAAGEQGERWCSVSFPHPPHDTCDGNPSAPPFAALLSSGGRDVALTDTFVQRVPDKCDRIIWRNRYYALPLAATLPGKDAAREQRTSARVCCGEYSTCNEPCTPRGRWQVEQEQQNAAPQEATRAEHGQAAGTPLNSPAVAAPPFDNCRFKLCDLPGQCRIEGKCHHPRSTPETPAGVMVPRELLERAIQAIGRDGYWSGKTAQELRSLLSTGSGRA